MSNYQIRIRTDVEWEQLDFISDWLKEAARGFAFEHKIPDNHHYHVYLFGLERNGDAMRRHLGKHLPTKECYALSATCGKPKRPVEPVGAYNYGTTKALIDPLWSKGFTDEQMKEFHCGAIRFWQNIIVKTDEVMPKEKVVRLSYQQSVIADAMADWYQYKRTCREVGEDPDHKQVVDFVCKAMRGNGRGINPYLVNEIGYGILYDDEDHRERLLRKLKSNFIV